MANSLYIPNPAIGNFTLPKPTVGFSVAPKPILPPAPVKTNIAVKSSAPVIQKVSAPIVNSQPVRPPSSSQLPAVFSSQNTPSSNGAPKVPMITDSAGVQTPAPNINGNPISNPNNPATVGSGGDVSLGYQNMVGGPSGTANSTPATPGLSSDIASLYAKYGVTGGVTPPGAPVTKEVNLPDYSQNQDYQNSESQIQANLDATKSAIQSKYDVLENQAALDTQNETQSTTGNLYRMGETNPLGSSVGDIKNMGEKNLSIRQSQLEAAKNEEIMTATNQAFSQNQTEKQNAQAYSVTQEQATQNENARITQDFQNKWTDINNSVTLVKSGQQITNDEQNQNFDHITKMLTQFGSQAFNGVSGSDLANIEKAAGMPAGTLEAGLQTMKEKELYGKLNLRQLMDGSLVNVSIGTDGKPVSQTLFPPQTNVMVQGIIDGSIPPDLSGYGSQMKTAVTEALAEKGFNLSQAVNTWNATKKQINTLNNNQQTSLRQIISNVTKQVNSLDAFNQKAEEAMHRAGITDFSKVQRTIAEQGYFGNDVKQAFLDLDGQIAEIIPELSKIYSGNGVGTDAKMDEAAKQLSADWDYATMKDQIQRVYQNLGFRINAMNDTSVAGIGGGQSPYQPIGSNQQDNSGQGGFNW